MRAVLHTQLGRTLSALALFSFVGCSKIVSPGGSTTGGNTLSGIVQLARVSGATISVFEMHSDGSKGSLLASTTTDSNGEYTVSLGTYSGSVIVESNGGTYNDEATGTTKTATTLSAIAGSSTASNAPITPMSHLVKERTIALLATRTLTLSEAKTQAVSEVAGLFGVSAEDLSVTPTSATALSSLNTRATRAALGLAAFSYLLKDFRHSGSAVSVEEALEALAEDLKDDGKINGSVTRTVTKKLAMEWKASMAAAKTAAAANSSLVFSKISSDILAEVSSTTLDTGSELDGLQDDGSFYINGVNTGLQGGTGLFIEKYYYLGGLAQVENGPMEDGFYYKDGEKAEGMIGNCLFSEGLPFSGTGNGTLGQTDREYVNGHPILPLYFSGVVDTESGVADNDWGHLGNWWMDSQITVPASSLPGPYNDVTVLSSVQSNSTGGVPTVRNMWVMNNPNPNIETDFGIELTVTGVATFGQSGASGYGVWLYWDGSGTSQLAKINGDCVFNGATYGGGPYYRSQPGDAVVNGNATFNNGAYNWEAIITGNATFNDNSYNAGPVSGICTLNGGYIDVNDGSCGSLVYNNGYYNGVCYKDGSATSDLDASGTGVCSGTGRYYLNGNLLTGFHNDTYYVAGQPTSLDSHGYGVFENRFYIGGQVTSLDKNGTGIWNGISYFNASATYNGNTGEWNSTVYGNPTFNGMSAIYYSTVYGNPTFNETSQNYHSTIYGNPTFNNSSQNYLLSKIYGDATFNDTSVNSNSTIYGNPTFNNSSQNFAGIVVGDAIFNDTSVNSNSAIYGNATFNDNSYNNDAHVLGNATFNNSSKNRGTVTGTCFLNGGINDEGGSCGSIVYFTGLGDGTLGEQNKYYSNGALFTGLGDGTLGEQNKYYSSGSLLTGTAANGSCYINGEERGYPDSFIFGDYGSTPVTDTNLNTLSNYWRSDTWLPATCFPDSNDSVTITSPVTSGTLNAQTIYLQSNFSGGILNGSVTIGKGGEAGVIMSGGTINGDVAFGVTGYTMPSYPILEGGTINGNVTFESGSIMVGGTINGNATYNGLTGCNGSGCFIGGRMLDNGGNGLNSWNNVYYSNGNPGSGFDNGVCYNYGSATTSVDGSGNGFCSVTNTYYLSGQTTPLDSNGNGTWNGLLYSAGQLFSGAIGSDYYQDGALANGLIDDIFYADGKPSWLSGFRDMSVDLAGTISAVKNQDSQIYVQFGSLSQPKVKAIDAALLGDGQRLTVVRSRAGGFTAVAMASIWYWDHSLFAWVLDHNGNELKRFRVDEGYDYDPNYSIAHAITDSGRVAFIWRRDGTDGNNYRIRIFDSVGSYDSGVIGLSMPCSYAPKIALNPATDSGVVTCQNFAGSSIYYRLFDKFGNLSSNAISVTNKTSWYDSHLVAMNQEGQFVVLSTDNGGGATVAVFFDENGNQVSTKTIYSDEGSRINTTFDERVNIDVDSQGNFALPWLNYPPPVRSSSSTGVSIYTPNGTFIRDISHAGSEKFSSDSSGNRYYLVNGMIVREAQ